MQTQDSIEIRFKEVQGLHLLHELLTNHLKTRGSLPAYTEFSQKENKWVTFTYAEMDKKISRWEKGFISLGLKKGDKVAMLLPNCVDAICFDQAALRQGLVPVPLHAVDTPLSSAFILNNSETKFLVTNRVLKFKQIRLAAKLDYLKDVVVTDNELSGEDANTQIGVHALAQWLDSADQVEITHPEISEDDLACLVYTSGTTGKPKGVMLTHKNILSNVVGVVQNIAPYMTDVWFSFLPLSHTFERTTTYYTALAFANQVYFNRNILKIIEDMQYAKPTVVMSVPRIYERIYAKVQDGLSKQSALVRFIFNWAVDVGWRRFCRENQLECESSALAFLDPLVAGFLDKKVGLKIRKILGNGNPHAFISGGASISRPIIKMFCGLGIPIHQGYGMTETSPIVTVNKPGSNNPFTVGPKLPNIEVRLAPGTDELQVKGPSVMAGYWKREDANREIFTEDGWLRTGDQAQILPTGHIIINGRIKEIIVTSSGEKIPPVDLEQAIERDPLFAQTMAIGEGRPFISLAAVLDKEQFGKLCESLGLDAKDPEVLSSRPLQVALVKRVKTLAQGFPQYGVPRRVIATLEPWTIENGALTPTLKIKRRVILERFRKEIETVYEDK